MIKNIVMKIKIKQRIFYLQLMVIGVLGKSGVSAPNPVVAEFKSE